MSAETRQAIHDAIQAHYREQHGDDAILTDWFVAYGGMDSSEDADDGIGYPSGYTSSTSSPYAVLGVAHMGLSELSNDLTPYEEGDNE